MPKLTDYITTTSQVDLIKAALEEDIGSGDITTDGCLGETATKSTARLIAQSDGSLAGIGLFALAFEVLSGSESSCELTVEDGARFVAGQEIAALNAPTPALLSAERVALNFLGKLSGIATLSAKYVDEVKHTKCVILDTRKTTPLWRQLEKYAVACGGAHNHRLGLYDMALIKENHVAAAGSICKAVECVREYLRTQERGAAIEVEVRNETELRDALDCGVERVLLDNQTPETIAHMVALVRELAPGVKCEASGNVTLDTVAAIAETGVDYISVGALTHSAPCADFSLLINK
jgi:nicotinate-nucleotide pyrophosphorylase (carboxylating)